LIGVTYIRDRHSTITEFEDFLGCHQSGPSLRLPDLPTGFTAYRTIITHDILILIRKILHLQRLASQDVLLTESIQTNLEAQLIFVERECKAAGLISECCLVAIYIIVCLDNPIPWRSAYVPLRLGQKLLYQLKDSMDSDFWHDRRDLFLWLLLVGSSTCTGKCCLAVELSGLYRELILRVKEKLRSWDDVENLRDILCNATDNFVYSKKWAQDAPRHRIAGWHDLEQTLLSEKEQVGDEHAGQTRVIRSRTIKSS
jgi:hypothetical protein